MKDNYQNKSVQKIEEIYTGHRGVPILIINKVCIPEYKSAIFKLLLTEINSPKINLLPISNSSEKCNAKPLK